MKSMETDATEPSSTDRFADKLLFWDFPSLPQKDHHFVREGEQDKRFQEAIKGMGHFYASLFCSAVLQLKDVNLPESPEFDGCLNFFIPTETGAEQAGETTKDLTQRPVPSSHEAASSPSLDRAAALWDLWDQVMEARRGPHAKAALNQPLRNFMREFDLEVLAVEQTHKGPLTCRVHVLPGGTADFDERVSRLSKALPKAFNVDTWYNKLSYEERGWPTFESAASRLVELINLINECVETNEKKSESSPWSSQIIAAQKVQVKMTLIGRDESGEAGSRALTSSVFDELHNLRLKLADGDVHFSGSGDNVKVLRMLDDLLWLVYDGIFNEKVRSLMGMLKLDELELELGQLTGIHKGIHKGIHTQLRKLSPAMADTMSPFASCHYEPSKEMKDYCSASASPRAHRETKPFDVRASACTARQSKAKLFLRTSSRQSKAKLFLRTSSRVHPEAAEVEAELASRSQQFPPHSPAGQLPERRPIDHVLEDGPEGGGGICILPPTLYPPDHGPNGGGGTRVDPQQLLTQVLPFEIDADLSWENIDP